MKTITEVRYSSLAHFLQKSRGLSHVPSANSYFKNFIKELKECKELVTWLSKFEDLQHEVDILKNSGDTRLVTVLGDLDAVKSWLIQLKLLDSIENGYLLLTFLISFPNGCQ